MAWARGVAAAAMCHDQLALVKRGLTGGPKILYLMSPEYRNYGDVAIAEGAAHLLSEAVGLENVVELTNTFCMRWPDKVAALARPNDVLVFTGGGYMGDLWPDSQAAVERILASCPKNPAVLLPQTVYYRNPNGEGPRRFAKVLGTRDKLTVLLRDAQSLSCMKSLTLGSGARVELAPDCALLLGGLGAAERRSGLVMCLRKDQESRGVVSEELCCKVAGSLGLSVRLASTVGNLAIPLPRSLRERSFKKAIEPFRTAELVVTDRLHATVLAALSGTPVVAFDNVSGKVSGVIRAWLPSLTYVRVLDAPERIEAVAREIMRSTEGERRESLHASLKALNQGAFVHLAALLKESLHL